MENLTTATNSIGDVATYLFQDGKHTMFTFDARNNQATVDTLTFVMDEDVFTYLSISESLIVSSAVLTLEQGMAAMALWKNTEAYVQALAEIE